ncbi:hypothetical protein PoB_005738400, partial [Plakobranchus ocellatus]
QYEAALVGGLIHPQSHAERSDAGCRIAQDANLVPLSFQKNIGTRDDPVLNP